MTHPSSYALEALACGEAQPAAAEHVAECAACGEFVARARAASSLMTEVDVARAVAGARQKNRKRQLVGVATMVGPMAAAAALLMMLTTRRSPELRSGQGPEPTGAIAASEEPETTFKGGMQLAVIRERGSVQERFTSEVRVQPGDRLRLELALDRAQPILGAVLGDDGSYLELMPSAVRSSGTHLSEVAARIDATPMNGVIVLGTPDAIRAARAMRQLDGVRTLRVVWEAAR